MSTSERIESAYVLDTHALIWYLTAKEKLSPRVWSIFEAAQRGGTQLIISAIVLAEMFYSHKKRRLFDSFAIAYHELKEQAAFQFVPFNPEHALDLETDDAVPEMHDRILVGLARRLGVPLISVDQLITAVQVVEVVW